MISLSRFLLLLVSATACRVMNPVPQPEPSSGFESVFPDENARKRFEELAPSVIRLTAYINYRTIFFEPDSLVTLLEIKKDLALSFIRASIVRNESYSGTATILSVKGNSALLLSCAHNVSFPDTLFTYNDKANMHGERYLLGLSVKTGQILVLNGPVGVMQAKVLVADTENDLALLEVEAVQVTSIPCCPVLKLAEVSSLNWGDRVWLAGYPSGRFMLTSGLLSIPEDTDGIILTDAPFSEGYSGAPALVYNLKAGEFLLAGVGRSVAAHSEYVIRPEKKIHEIAYNTALPYEGPNYVEIEKQAAPGVTFIASSDIISGFLRSNRGVLEENGWTNNLIPASVHEMKEKD
ncbi:MAG: serine protease [Bacteroidota bacterium]